MVRSGDEGIKQQFFNDLDRFFPPPELDPLLQNVGLKSNETDNVSDDSTKEPSSEIVGNRSTQFPIRPDVADCSFYVRTGACKFGPACKFNHPVLSENLVDSDNKSNGNGNGGGGSSKILSRIPCKFYPAGLCKYGESCRFNHSKTEADISTLQLNYRGLPKRLGKMICPFYLRTGMCGYGTSCRFHHPDPIMVLFRQPTNNCKEAVESTQSHISLPVIAATNIPFVHQNYVASASQTQKGKQKVEIAEDFTPKREPCFLNDVGLPIRPGKKVCWNYEKLGMCNFGRACAYDHPKKHVSAYGSTSASPSGVKTPENGTPQE